MIDRAVLFGDRIHATVKEEVVCPKACLLFCYTLKYVFFSPQKE